MTTFGRISLMGAAAFAVVLTHAVGVDAKLSDLPAGSEAQKVAGKCFATIQKEAAKYAAAHAKLIVKCKANVVKGKGGTLADCNTGVDGGFAPVTGLAEKDDKNATKLGDKIAGKCGGKDKLCGVGVGDEADIPLADISWDIGFCPDLDNQGPGDPIANCGDIAPCIVGRVRVANHSVLNDAGADVFNAGLFGDGGAGKNDNKCQQAAFKEINKFYQAKLKSVGKCWQAKGKLKVGSGFDDADPCPETDPKGKTKAAIEKIEQKIAKGLCGKCSVENGTPLKLGDGNKDGVCDGDDKITPEDVAAGDLNWFSGLTCPSVNVPPSNVLHRYDNTSLTPGGAYGDDNPANGADCGAIGTIDSLQEYIDCVTCVAEYKADCVLALANGEDPALGMVYPSECVGNLCGNGVIDVGETCDPAASAPQCPNAGNGLQDCNPSTCQCDCPSTVTFEPDPNDPSSVLDSGFSGFAHGSKVIGLGTVTVALSGGTSGTPGIRDPDCGEMTISGPLQNPNANAGQLDVQRCSLASQTSCNADSDCPASQTCDTYFGAPLPLSAGGVSACVRNRFTAPIVGTADIETGDSANTVAISSTINVGPSVDKPCDNCLGDLVANDGSPDGTCDTGTRAGLACDVGGISPIPAFNGGVPGIGLVNGTSLDCTFSPLGSNDGVLPINLSNSTGVESLSVEATGPTCTASGFGGSTCLCDTCDSLAGEPCNKDSDCLIGTGTICGGLRCLGGGSPGTPCTTPGIGDPACGGAPCGTIGEPTKPNGCSGSCTAGSCASGPFNGFCGPTETFRGCLVASDCPFPGDSCGFIAQPCFDDNGVVGASISAVGAADPPVNDVSNPTLGSTFCIAPTAASAINAATGLPGAGRVTLKGTANGLPAP